MFTPAICFSLRHVQIVLPEVRRSPGQIRKYLHSLCESGVSWTLELDSPVHPFLSSRVSDHRNHIVYEWGGLQFHFECVREILRHFFHLTIPCHNTPEHLFLLHYSLDKFAMSFLHFPRGLRKRLQLLFKIMWDFHMYEKYQASHRTWNRRAYPLRFDQSTLWLHDIRLFFS